MTKNDKSIICGERGRIKVAAVVSSWVGGSARTVQLSASMHSLQLYCFIDAFSIVSSSRSRRVFSTAEQPLLNPPAPGKRRAERYELVAQVSAYERHYQRQVVGRELTGVDRQIAATSDTIISSNLILITNVDWWTARLDSTLSLAPWTQLSVLLLLLVVRKWRQLLCPSTRHQTRNALLKFVYIKTDNQSLKHKVNRLVLSSSLNEYKLSASPTAAGKLFHTTGPAIQKALSPNFVLIHEIVVS